MLAGDCLRDGAQRFEPFALEFKAVGENRDP